MRVVDRLDPDNWAHTDERSGEDACHAEKYILMQSFSATCDMTWVGLEPATVGLTRQQMWKV